MIYQPSNMLPSPFAGDGMGTIDATKSNAFFATINGTSPVLAYRLIIYKNTAENEVVYDTNKVTLDDPFYPFLPSGISNEFSVTIPDTSGLTNGYENGYKWTLELWWNDADSITSFETFFDTQATPSIFIDVFPETILSKSINLTATYISGNSIPLMWFKWILAEDDVGSTIVRQTSEIRGSAKVAFAYDGLKTDTQYKVKCIAKNQSGIMIDSGWVQFNVAYPIIDYNGSVAVAHVSDNGIMIDISKTQFIEGVPSSLDGYKIKENYPLVGHNSVQLNSGETVIFEGNEQFSLDVADNAIFAYCIRLRGDGDVLRIESIDGNNYRMLVHDGSLVGLIPSEDLVPEEDLAPQDNDGGEYIYTVNGTTYVFDTEFTNNEWHLLFLKSNGIELIGLGDLGGAVDWS